MLKTPIESGYDLFIDFCDRDNNWSFLLFLRPERHERITHGRALLAAVLLGLPLGMFGSILVAVIARELGKTPPALMAFPIVLIGVYFFAAQFTLFRAWNERASRLARTK